MFSDVIDSLVAVVTSLTSQPLVQKALGEQTYIIYAYKHTYSYIPSPPSVNHISVSRLLAHLLLLPSLHFLLTLLFICLSLHSTYVFSVFFSSILLRILHPYSSPFFDFLLCPFCQLLPLFTPPYSLLLSLPQSLSSLLLSQFSLSVYSLCSTLSLLFIRPSSFSCFRNYHHWEKSSSQ